MKEYIDAFIRRVYVYGCQKWVSIIFTQRYPFSKLDLGDSAFTDNNPITSFISIEEI